ncbi:MAG: hypothetical protein FJZ90_07765 [Chloroflexi bacterium]|nr:hypothetical protein [Chloroflexota bacterium]
MDWKEFFEIMVIDEQAAKAKYERALAVTDDAEIRAVLERLRDEEAFHIDYLQENWQRISARMGKK